MSALNILYCVFDNSSFPPPQSRPLPRLPAFTLLSNLASEAITAIDLPTLPGHLTHSYRTDTFVSPKNCHFSPRSRLGSQFLLSVSPILFHGSDRDLTYSRCPLSRSSSLSFNLQDTAARFTSPLRGSILLSSRMRLIPYIDPERARAHKTPPRL